MYIPLQQEYVPQINLHVRTASDAKGMVAALRNEVQQIDPSLPMGNTQTLSERVENSLGGERSQATLLGSGGILALILAAVGLYGVMSYSVAQRTREIGIRMALGAGRGNVMGLVLKQGVTLVSAGVVLGLGAAFWITRYLASLLFGVSAIDPITFAGTSALLIVVRTTPVLTLVAVTVTHFQAPPYAMGGWLEASCLVPGRYMLQATMRGDHGEVDTATLPVTVQAGTRTGRTTCRVAEVVGPLSE